MTQSTCPKTEEIISVFGKLEVSTAAEEAQFCGMQAGMLLVRSKNISWTV